LKKLFVFLAVLAVMGSTSIVRAEMEMNDSGSKPTKVTLSGTLVDVTCYLDDGDTGNDHMGMKKCGTDCLNGGSPAGLLVGKKLYILVFTASAFANYVGQKVEVTGDLYGETNLIPKKANAVASDGTKKAINIKGKAMM
jgi:type 1 fimbria pilin